LEWSIVRGVTAEGEEEEGEEEDDIAGGDIRMERKRKERWR